MTRETVLAGNIANANTPGYRARDVAPFSETLSKAGISQAITNAGHQQSGLDAKSAIAVRDKTAREATLSGNSVGLEEHLMNIGDVSRSYSLNVNIRRVFHQMLISSSR